MKTPAEKAAKMKEFTRLSTVCRFLDTLGPWPKTDDEWAVSYDLWVEEKQRAMENMKGR